MDETIVNKEQETASAGTSKTEQSGGSANSGTANDAAKSGNPQGETVNESSFTDSSEKGTREGEPSAKEDKREAQSREQNAENARRRRDAERQKELRKLREKTIIEALGGKNPYTGEEMKDSLDVEEFETMREIEKNGGDPVNDYPKFRKQKAREAIAEREERGKTEEWYAKDREAFETEYPDVNLSELIRDEAFSDYADGKVGRKPLSEIYRGFLKFTGKYEGRAKDMAAQYIANQKASPGTLRDTQAPDSDFFTEEQVRKMSPSEVSKNYEKIRKSMKKWK